MEGEEDEEHLEVLPVGHQVVVVVLLARVVALPLLDCLKQGVIKCGNAGPTKKARGPTEYSLLG